jgi:hypothetical protein
MEEITMKLKTLVVGLIAGAVSMFGATASIAAEASHTAQALEHAQAAAKESTLQGVQEHAKVSLTHVKAAEKAKEKGTDHLGAAETALNDALKAKDAESAKKAAESAVSHLKMIQPCR